jgi:hypothetical protein
VVRKKPWRYFVTACPAVPFRGIVVRVLSFSSLALAGKYDKTYL